MNLCLVTETFPPEINGVAMTLRNLVEGLCERGHAVSVCRPRQGAEAAAPPTSAWQEHLFRGFSAPGYPQVRLGFPAPFRLRKIWTANRPDVVHIATEGPLGWSALRTARALGIPVSSSFHTNFHQYSQHYGAAWTARPVLGYLRWFHNRAALTLSPTAELNEQLVRDGFTGVRLLARGVNSRVFSPRLRDEGLRRLWGAGPSDCVVIHVSRLAAEKNYPLVIEGWQALRARQPRTRCVMVSDGPLRSRLQRMAPWAHFTGFIDRDALARHYASADLFLYASETETFGNVVTEAMASGLTVVAYRYAAPARYIDSGINGITVPLGNREAWLAAALKTAGDAESLRRMGRAARQTAETISWDTVVERFVEDLRSLLAPNPALTGTR
ncbi:MAG: glycosyltransferase family 1 protein [Opitutaceae bacterium]